MCVLLLCLTLTEHLRPWSVSPPGGVRAGNAGAAGCNAPEGRAKDLPPWLLACPVWEDDGGGCGVFVECLCVLSCVVMCVIMRMPWFCCLCVLVCMFVFVTGVIHAT